MPTPDWINVKDKGATGNGSTDDLGAFNQAATDVADDGIVYIPGGLNRDYLLSARWDLPHKNMHVIGSGNLIFTGAGGTAGIRHNQSGSIKRLTLRGEGRGLYLLTQVAGGGHYALGVIGPTGVSSYYNRHVQVEGVIAQGFNTGSHYWSYGVVFDNAWTTIVQDFLFRGKDGGYATGALVGGKVNANCVGVEWARCNWFNVESGMRVDGDGSEAMSVIGGSAVDVKYGLVYGAPSTLKPQGPVRGWHADAAQYGIYALRAAGLQIIGCKLFKLVSSVLDYKDIVLDVNSHRAVIMGNSFEGAGAGGATLGVSLNTEKALVEGNQFVNRGTECELLGSAAYNVVKHNLADPGSFAYTGALGTNVVSENTP